jgi:hypothetical protein
MPGFIVTVNIPFNDQLDYLVFLDDCKVKNISVRQAIKQMIDARLKEVRANPTNPDLAELNKALKDSDVPTTPYPGAVEAQKNLQDLLQAPRISPDNFKDK